MAIRIGTSGWSYAHWEPELYPPGLRDATDAPWALIGRGDAALLEGLEPQAAVTIAERAYLGEFWDYVVALPEGGTRLRVTTPPLEIHEVGAGAWLAFDPKQMTPIS